jgi:enoyl-CoA hydratase/carnithine racemase
VPASEASVVVERHRLTAGGEAAFLWLNRSGSLNALDWTMIRSLETELRAVDGDPAVRVVFVVGMGRAFSAGGDLKAYLELQADPVAFPAFLDDLHRTFANIAGMSKPVMALVNGVTAAGGLELLLSCDFAIAAQSARIGDAHLNFGQIGGGGSLALLPRAIGPARARELVFTGRFLTADEAADYGLVNCVVPDGKLISTALSLAESMAEHSAAALTAAKSVMNTAWGEGTGLPIALRLERERAALYCLTLPDSMAGLRLFSSRHDRQRESHVPQPDQKLDSSTA